MEKLTYSIREEYSGELIEIAYILNNLKDGRVCEIYGAQTDGFLATNAKKLELKIAILLYKIQNGKEGTETEMLQLFNLNK